MIAVNSHHDVPEGHAFKTQSGRWFQVRPGDRYPQIDMGNATYYDGCKFGPIVEVKPYLPKLSEDEPFRVIVPREYSSTRTLVPMTNAKFVSRILPSNHITFQTDQGYFWRTQLQNYRISLSFNFETTDPRCPTSLANWTASSGTIWRHLVGNSLAIKWKDDQIVLSVFHQMFDGTRIQKMSIKSGQ